MTSLARLMVAPGTPAKSRQACRDDLRKVLSSFDEGADLPDLKEGRQVLAELE